MTRARRPSRATGVLAAVSLAVGALTVATVVPATPAAAADAIEARYAQAGPRPVTSTDVTDAAGNVVYQLFHPSDLAERCDEHPIITWGNGSFAVPSQYPGVLHQLASWGFVVVASTSTAVGTGAEMLAGAQYLVAENQRPGSTFFGKLDVTNVGAVGHSQGAGGAVNATNASEGLITSVVPIALPNRIFVGPGDEYELATLDVPVLLLSGVDDIIISSPATNAGFYDEVPGPAAMAARAGAGHNTIQGTGGGVLGYLTAWFRYTLADDTGAAGAFVGDAPEIETNASWRHQATKNLATGPGDPTDTGLVAGAVLGGDGAPVADALVMAYVPADGFIGACAVRTGADGSFTFAGLAPGSYRVVFVPPAGSGLHTEWFDDEPSRAAATPVVVTGGGTVAGVDAQLDSGGALSGTVSGPEGEPLDGVAVRAYHPGDGLVASAQRPTGADGTFAFDGLAPAAYRVVFVPPAGSDLSREWFDGAGSRAAATPVVVTGGGSVAGVDAQLAAVA